MAVQNSNWCISLYAFLEWNYWLMCHSSTWRQSDYSPDLKNLKESKGKNCLCKRSFAIYESKKISFKFWEFSENIEENPLNLVILFLDKILKTEYNHWQKTSQQRVSMINYFKVIMRVPRALLYSKVRISKWVCREYI